ncbi:helix-turn-helix transcriptional regulator [Zestomonas carbonaria]|uniref:Addiction module antidote protein, HigA family n=1 Tax=Zestomonas carbonaria TaxID=2762745 RepID=A0A7U7IAK6_9GAMM|nr:addiction module antidote protein, HigA family [Pseudomonas carbonaria]CAD5109554.1 hypothetical protein PSEWESI4_03859 [Pseudomonas carbonaria]
MVMHNPPHPGETLLEDVLPALDISIAELARRLGFARETLSRVWLGVQADYDLWQARQREQPHIERFAAIA